MITSGQASTMRTHCFIGHDGLGGVTVVYIDMPVEEISQNLARDALTGRVPQLSPSAVLALMEHGDVPDLDAVSALREAASDANCSRPSAPGPCAPSCTWAARTPPGRWPNCSGSDAQRVAIAAATALGQAGTPEQLPALRDLRGRTRNKVTRQRVAFAERLIVHRFGLADEDEECRRWRLFHTGPLAVGGRPFRGTRPGPERRKRALTT